MTASKKVFVLIGGWLLGLLLVFALLWNPHIDPIGMALSYLGFSALFLPIFAVSWVIADR